MSADPVTLPAWQVWLLLTLLAGSIVLAVAALLGLRRSSRELRSARRRLDEMIDPRDDPIAIRLRVLDHRLAQIGLALRRSGRRR